MTIERQIIKRCGLSAGISSSKELSEETGIPKSTLDHSRAEDSGTYRMWEFRRVVKATKMTDEDIVEFVRAKI